MYQVLARKYRPRNFIELVGQNVSLMEAVTRFIYTRGETRLRDFGKCLNGKVTSEDVTKAVVI